MHFLEIRDFNFDMLRAFLVISMIFVHVFEQFYITNFNWNLVAFVILGFVFLAGFVFGARYNLKGSNSFNWKNFVRQSTISFKLIFIYIICNIAILYFFPDRAYIIENMSLFEVAISSLLGVHQNVFGFDVLIPIALVIFISALILSFFPKKLFLPLISLLFILLIYIEDTRTELLNYYTIKLLIIGLMGTIAGRIISYSDWSNLIEKLSKLHSLAISGMLVVFYHFFIVFYTSIADILPFFILIFSTVIMFFFVYMLSYTLNFYKYESLKFIFLPISKDMLFAYLFHILVINLLFSVISRHEQSIFSCIFIGIIITSITLAIIILINYLTKRSAVIHNAYNLLFR